MRATILFLSTTLFLSSLADAGVFIFKSGKRIEGTVRFEDAKTYRIVDSTGVEMTLRKTELNLKATRPADPVSVADVRKAPVPVAASVSAGPSKPVRVYTNRDVPSKSGVSFVAPNPESERAWSNSLAKLEREFVRLQNACRSAGTGPNLSKVLKTHTYSVQGRAVHITGYWADPANIEDAKRICRRAIDTEETLRQARIQFEQFKQRQSQATSLTAR